MPTVTTKLQAMSHPTVVATINTLAEMADRLREENERLKKPWVGLTDAEIADCMEMSIQKTCRAVEQLLKERNHGT